MRSPADGRISGGAAAVDARGGGVGGGGGAPPDVCASECSPAPGGDEHALFGIYAHCCISQSQQKQTNKQTNKKTPQLCNVISFAQTHARLCCTSRLSIVSTPGRSHLLGHRIRRLPAICEGSPAVERRRREMLRPRSGWLPRRRHATQPAGSAEDAPHDHVTTRAPEVTGGCSAPRAPDR